MVTKWSPNGEASAVILVASADILVAFGEVSAKDLTKCHHYISRNADLWHLMVAFAFGEIYGQYLTKCHQNVGRWKYINLNLAQLVSPSFTLNHLIFPVFLKQDHTSHQSW